MRASDENGNVTAAANARAATGPRVRPTSDLTQKTPANTVVMKRQCQLQAHLGRNLQAVYKNLVKEPVPHRLNKFLHGLKRKEEEK